MNAITDADRDAARVLREVIADISGFWFRPGDESPLVTALVRHRLEAEQRLAEKLAPFMRDAEAGDESPRAPIVRTPDVLLPAPRAKMMGPFAA